MQITFGGILSLSSYSHKMRTELVDHCLKHHLIALKEPSVSPTMGEFALSVKNAHETVELDKFEYIMFWRTKLARFYKARFQVHKTCTELVDHCFHDIWWLLMEPFLI